MFAKALCIYQILMNKNIINGALFNYMVRDKYSVSLSKWVVANVPASAITDNWPDRAGSVRPRQDRQASLACPVSGYRQ